jgi:arylsulfatase
MDRRKFIALLSSGVAAGRSMPAFASPTLSDNAGPRPRGRQHLPNVILIICDDLGFGDIGCYGSRIPTPNLDAMAAGGVRLTRFNAAHPICSASRAALLTGRYGHRSQTTGAFGPYDRTGTSLDETLLSDLFHAAGYKTKAVGKWHLGNAGAYLPTHRGFDSFFGVPYSDDYYPLPLLRDTTVLEPDTDRDLLTPRYTDEAVTYINEQIKGEPFFLYHAFSYPHDPARASERFRGKTRMGDYGDAVAEIDWSVGEIVRAVEQNGLGADTLICFTSDHGPWYQGSPGLLRGRKGSAFEGGFRVPFLARWPGRIAPGGVDDAWYSNLDILPSLAALCGLKLPAKPLDGLDASEMLGGSDEKTGEDKPRLYFGAMGNDGLDVHCIRKQSWKLRVAQGVGEIYINDRTTGAGVNKWLQHPELYDLSQDPCESYDVAKFHPEIVAELSRDLEAMMPTFPPDVVAAYAALKQRKGDISTPPGASPRPDGKPNPDWSWEPKDRR